MKKIYSHLFLLCSVLYISIGFLNLNAKKINVEYVPDSQIKIDSKKLSQDFSKQCIDTASFINCREKLLYSNGTPKIEDVNQNALGVCYFLAAVVSVLAVDPQKIMDCLEDQNDGTVIVKLYDPYKGTLHKIKVEKSIPNLNDSYSFISNNSPLWIHILLKGFIASKLYVSSRNYKAAEGGFTAPILRMLTGNETTLYNGIDIGIMGRKKLVKKISDAIKSKNFVGCVFSPQTEFGKQLISTYDSENTLVDHHAYSIIGISQNNFITIRNPWGEDKFSKNGIHYMHIDKFFNCCSELEISSSEPMKKRGTFKKIAERIDSSLPGLLQILFEIILEYFKSVNNVPT